MKNSEILIKAKEVIVDPKNWVKGYYALDKNRSPVGRGTYLGAVCFCSVGAIQKVVGDTGNVLLYLHKVREVTKFLGDVAGEHITEYNDNHQHYEVMEVWDKAIELSLQNELKEESK